MNNPSQNHKAKSPPPEQNIIAHNTEILSPENISYAFRRKSFIMKDNKISQTLNVLAHKTTGKIEKIGSHLHDTDDPNLVNIYVSTDTQFGKNFTNEKLVKLELQGPNDLSPQAKAVLVASLKKVMSGME